MIEELALELIRRDGGTQPRAFMNTMTVMDYTEILQEGGTLPPVDVFYDGTDYWLADGYHRIQAAKAAGFKSFPCVVHQGNIEAAQWFSFSANKNHGLRRTNADKQRVVEAAVKHKAASKMSNIEIADHCGVSRETVRKYRESILQNLQDNPTRTVTRNGKQYTQNVANIGKTKSPKTEAAPGPEPKTTVHSHDGFRPAFRSVDVYKNQPEAEEPKPFPVIKKVAAIVAIRGAMELLKRTPPDVEGAIRELESADVWDEQGAIT